MPFDDPLLPDNSQTAAFADPSDSMSPSAVENYIRQGALRRGIDPNIAATVFRGESSFNPAARGDNNTSFGPTQLHYGGGLGDVFTQQTGLHASDPSTWRQQVDFSLDQARQGGWGPWHAWKGHPYAGIGTVQQASVDPLQQGLKNAASDLRSANPLQEGLSNAANQLRAGEQPGIFDDLKPGGGNQPGLFDDLKPKVSATQDVLQSMPKAGLEGFLGGAGVMSKLVSGGLPIPSPTGIIQGIQNKFTGQLPTPQGTPGEYSAAITRNVADPLSWVGGGGLLPKAAQAIGAGLGSESARRFAQGTALEKPFEIAGGVLGGGGLNILGNLAAPSRAAGLPTFQQLYDKADQLYGLARKTNVEIHPDSMGAVVDAISKTLRDKGWRPGAIADGRTPTFEALSELKSPNPTTLTDIDSVRKVLARAAGKGDGAAGRAINFLDSYVNSLGNTGGRFKGTPGVISGNADLASQLWSQARSHWASASKLERVEQAIDKAEVRAGQTGSGANINNLLRQEIGKIADKPRGFTQEEQAAMRAMRIGSGPQNVERALGKMAPSGVVSMGLSGGLGYHLAGLKGMLGSLGLGYAAKKMADRMTMNRAREIADMIAAKSPMGPGSLPPKTMSPGTAAALRAIGRQLPEVMP